MSLESLRLIRSPELKRLIGLSRSTIYEMMAEGTFPAAVRTHRRAVGWRQAEVVIWLESRPQATFADRE